MPTREMVLVVGPPCSGKTTWVREQAQPSDTIVDYDDICEEIGAPRYQATPQQKQQAQALWVQRIQAHTEGTCWVIWANPTRQQRARMRQDHDATVVRIMAPMDVCLTRAAADRPADWSEAIAWWFATYQPSRSTPERVVWAEQHAETGR